MKNLSIVLNVICLAAIAVLFGMNYSSGDEELPKEETTTEETAQGIPAMAYVNSDSLLANYDFFKDMQEKMKGMTEKLDKELQSRAAGIQRELSDYQKNASSLTMGQARALEENLMKKRQNLQLRQESATQQLLTEEAAINKELYEKVAVYVKEYSTENNIQMVVKFNPGSDVVYAANAMDITDEIVAGLNKAYQEELNPQNSEVESDSTEQK